MTILIINSATHATPSSSASVKRYGGQGKSSFHWIRNKTKDKMKKMQLHPHLLPSRDMVAKEGVAFIGLKIKQRTK